MGVSGVVSVSPSGSSVAGGANVDFRLVCAVRDSVGMVVASPCGVLAVSVGPAVCSRM